MYQALVAKNTDNVATAVKDLKEGEVVLIGCQGEKKIRQRVYEPIPLGHKFALKNIDKNQDVIKYGKSIGKATQTIQSGYHVHYHNLVGLSKANSGGMRDGER